MQTLEQWCEREGYDISDIHVSRSGGYSAGLAEYFAGEPITITDEPIYSDGLGVRVYGVYVADGNENRFLLRDDDAGTIIHADVENHGVAVASDSDSQSAGYVADDADEAAAIKEWLDSEIAVL